MPAKNVVQLPDAIAFETGAAMMLKGLTVQYLLKKTLPQGGLQPGDFVLFHAAAGGVGLIACQWAKALGLQPHRHRRQRRRSARSRSNTAPRTAIDYNSEDFVARVKEITGGQGVKVVYDSVGKDTCRALARLPAPVRPDGQLRQRIGAGAAVQPRAARREGLAVRDAADAVHAHRDAREHAGDGRRPVRRRAVAAR